MKKLISQVLKFGVVGGLAFLIDYAVLIILTELVGINYLISSGVSFCVSVVFNYILSIVWVFDVEKNMGKKKVAQNFFVFIVLSVIGLVLTEILMWTGTDILGIHYLLTKIGATAIVMIYNFVSRKIFLEGKK